METKPQLLTENQKQFIKDNFAKFTRREMVEQVGCTDNQLKRFAYLNGLRFKSPYVSVTQESREFIMANHKTMTRMEIAEHLDLHISAIDKFIREKAITCKKARNVSGNLYIPKVEEPKAIEVIQNGYFNWKDYSTGIFL